MYQNYPLAFRRFTWKCIKIMNQINNYIPPANYLSLLNCKQHLKIMIVKHNRTI